MINSKASTHALSNKLLKKVGNAGMPSSTTPSEDPQSGLGLDTLKFSKIGDWKQFELILFKDEDDKKDIQKKLEGIAYVAVFDSIL